MPNTDLYRILCADLVTPAGTSGVRDDLCRSLHDFKWSRVLDAPGAVTGWISMDDPKCTRANLDPGATAIYVERGGLLVWGGILWTAAADNEARRVTIGCAGFWSYFRRRRIRALKTYAAQDQLFIARDLINYALAQPGSLAGIAVGSETCGVLRDRTYYAYERKRLGEAVEQLASVINGFDFGVEVAWDGTGLIPVRTFQLFYPKRGTRPDGLVFNHNILGVSKLTNTIDANNLANLVDAMGQGDGDNMLIATAADTTLLPRYPLLEDTVDAKDVNVQATLNAKSAAAVGRSKQPLETVTISKRAGGAQDFPDIGSFQEGDEAFVIANDNYINVGSYQRITAYEVSVSDEGQETMTPTFVSTDATVN